MEACLVKPGVKKKAQPPKPPPKPAKTKRSSPERLDSCLEPLQTADAANVVSKQRERKASSTKTPKVPPRLKEKELKASARHSQRRSGETENTKTGRELSPDLKAGRSEKFAAKEKNETNPETKQEKLGVMTELSASTDSLTEHNPEKVGLFDRMFRKSPKPQENAQTKEMSGSTDSLSEHSKEKGQFFGGFLRKTPKEGTPGQDREAKRELSASNDDLTASDDDLSEKSTTKEKNIFSNMFKKPQKQAVGAAAGKELEVKTEKELFGSSENLSDASAPKEKSGNLFSGLLKKTPKPSEETSDSADREAKRELSASNDDLTASDDDLSEKSTTKEKNIFSNMFKKSQKQAVGAAAGKELEVKTEKELFGSGENLSDASAPKEKSGNLFSGLLKKTPKPSEETSESADREAKRELSASNDDLTASDDDLSEKNTTKEKNIFSNMFKKPQKQAVGAAAGKELEVKTEKELFGSGENLSDASAPKEKSGNLFSGLLKKTPKPSEETSDSADREAKRELSASNDDLTASDDDLSEKNTTKEKNIFSNMFKKPQKQAVGAAAGKELEVKTEKELFGSSENLSDASAPKERSGNLFSGLLKKTPKPSEETSESADREAKRELSASNDDLTASDDDLSEKSTTKEKNIFSNMFKKPQKQAVGAAAGKELEVKTEKELFGSGENLSDASAPKEKSGNLFSGLLKKTPKPSEETSDSADREAKRELSASNDDLTASDDDLSEKNTTKEKNIFSNMFKKPQKQAVGAAAGKELEVKTEKELFGSGENLSDASAPKERSGNLFSGLLKKTPKPSEETSESADREAKRELSASNDDLTASDDDLSEKSTTKEKNIFSNMFKKPQKQAVGAAAGKELEVKTEKELFGSSENLSDASAPKEKSGNLFSGLLKKTPKPSEETSDSADREAKRELSASNDDLTASDDDLSEKSTTKEKNIFSNMFKKSQKQAVGAAAGKELEVKTEKELFGSSENLSDASAPKEKKGGLAGIFKRSSSIENLFDEEKGVFSGMFKRSNKAAKEATSDEESGNEKEMSASDENLSEATIKEKTGGLAGYFKKSPKPAPRSVVAEDPLTKMMEASSSCDSLTETAEERADVESGRRGRLSRRATIKKKKRVVSFRVKKTLPRIPKADQTSEKMPLIEEAVELQELNPATADTQESTVEVQPVEMVSYPSEGNPVESEEESDELMEWWNTVKGWAEWNAANNFQDNEEMALEQAADRVYMAARLFVRLFNQRGASLQRRILELLALADTADQFHKKTVTAAVGGGVASVAGSIVTITGLILAPFTFGASIIVTAVGIGVATAGSITSATANITDTVHSNMDRKKLEKMIQDYQDEIKVIRECLEFVQAGMDTLQEWDFEKYSQSAAKKALNHNIKHVMKEGGRAGKALMINTDKLISTVQILGTAGGAAKAVQAISVTTGVMSALFLALDVFFLAKDSHELRKGAKTKFANKIRDVCKELQDGLLELNKVKTQLQKTMDGIEVEEYEEIEEVEVEVDDDLASDPKKLAELEQELDLMEEKLDKKMEEGEKYKVTEKDQEKGQNGTKKGANKDIKEKEEDKGGNQGNLKKKDKVNKLDLKLESEESEQKNEAVSSLKVGVEKDSSQKERKADKETVNHVIASKEKAESMKDTDKKESGLKNQTDMKEKEKKTEKEHIKRAQSESKREEQHGRSHPKRESERSKDAEKEVNTKKEVECGDMKSRHERREAAHEKGCNKQSTMEDWRAIEERNGMQRRAEMSVKSEETSRRSHREGDVRKRSHRSRTTQEHSEPEPTSSREECKRRLPRTAAAQGEPVDARAEKSGNGSTRKKSESTQDRERRRSRHGDGDTEGRPRHRGSQGRSSVLREDGLYI